MKKKREEVSVFVSRVLVSCVSDPMDEYQRGVFTWFTTASTADRDVIVRAGAGSGKSYLVRELMRALGPRMVALSHTVVAAHNLGGKESRSHTIHSIASTAGGSDRTSGEGNEQGGGTAGGQGECDYEAMLDRGLQGLQESSLPNPADETFADAEWVVVDEFQDTGSKQMRFLRALQRRYELRLLAVGDLAQAIYGFQRASPRHMLGLRGPLFELRSNYRSHPSIVAWANAFAARAGAPIAGHVVMDAKCLPHDDDDASRFPPLVLEGVKSNNTLSHEVCRRICEIRVAHPDWTIAVLCRKIQGKARLLNGIYHRLLVSEQTKAFRDDFKLEHIYFREDDHVREEMMHRRIVLCTGHAAKGLEWDAVLHVDEGDAGRPYPPRAPVKKEEEGDDEDDDDPTTAALEVDAEEKRILYVIHTRAKRHLVQVCVCHEKRTLSRHMGDEAFVRAHWTVGEGEKGKEAADNDGGVRYFSSVRSDADDSSGHEDVVAIKEVAKVTLPYHRISTTLVSETVLGTPAVLALPRALKDHYNVPHGMVCEWIALWHLHGERTHRDLRRFLDVVLHRFSVNKYVAKLLLGVWKHSGSTQARRRVRDAFLRAVAEDDPGSAEVVWQCAVDALLAPSEEGGDESLSSVLDDHMFARGREHLKSAIRNAYRQRNVVSPREGEDECPVRWTIPFFDEASGGDRDTMDRGMWWQLIVACRSVEQHGLEAPARHLALACILCNCLNLEAFWSEANADRVDVKGMTTLAVCMRGNLDAYVRHLEAVRATVCADAQRLRTEFAATTAQQVEVRSKARYATGSSYLLHGFADAVSPSQVLEITSRRRHEAVKVQQVCLYALHLGCSDVVNYFVEERVVQVRRLDETSTSRMSMEPVLQVLYCKRGSPGNKRQRLASPEVEWEVANA